MRELAIWDSRNLASAVTRIAVGQGSGAFNPMFDEDTNVLFLNAKGEGTVYYYELVNEDPWLHLCGRYVSQTPAVGMAQMHKTMYDVKEVEIFKVLKLNTNGVEPTSFKVPRTRVCVWYRAD
jgi:hypothetical protein